MQPYEELFGFARNKNFNATLFRLPFRSHPSELSSTCYSESSTRALLAEIKTACDQLVLFLQNVHTISVLRIDSGMSDPLPLFEVRKTKPNICNIWRIGALFWIKVAVLFINCCQECSVSILPYQLHLMGNY